MKIQSLSVVVPNRQCINHCRTCPSRMHDNDYPMLIDESQPDFDLHLGDYLQRLEYARDNGCNVLMLTGTSEPQQNRKFLLWFGMMMKLMKKPFRNIEIQCTGALLDEEYLRFLRRHVGVVTVALSVFALGDFENQEIVNPPKGVEIDICDITRKIREAGMSLRMCLNLTDHFDFYKDNPEEMFTILKEEYGAKQVTLRVLYASDDDRPENVFVRENSASPETVAAFKSYIRDNGTLLGKLPYGASKYGVHGMSVVLDDDSMGKESDDADSYKYLILRPNCRLYSSWDDPASMVF